MREDPGHVRAARPAPRPAGPRAPTGLLKFQRRAAGKAGRICLSACTNPGRAVRGAGCPAGPGLRGAPAAALRECSAVSEHAGGEVSSRRTVMWHLGACRRAAGALAREVEVGAGQQGQSSPPPTPSLHKQSAPGWTQLPRPPSHPNPLDPYGQNDGKPGSQPSTHPGHNLVITSVSQHPASPEALGSARVAHGSIPAPAHLLLGCPRPPQRPCPHRLGGASSREPALLRAGVSDGLHWVGTA